MIGIVVSEADRASVTIGEQLLSLQEWEEVTAREDDIVARYRSGHFELCAFREMHLYVESVAEYFTNPTLIVFVSRHAGDTGPLLTAHYPGNIGRADFGGQSFSLPQAAPLALSKIMPSLRHYAPADFDVTIECTHHGPSDVGAPCLFVEVGSSEAEWSDPKPANAVAKAVLNLQFHDDWWSDRTVVGLGGNHYAPRFDRIVRETDWTVGHIAAEWSLEQLNDDERLQGVIQSMLENSNASRILLDESTDRVTECAGAVGDAIVTETWLRESTGVSLDLVAQIEAKMGAIDGGIRIGTITDISPEDLAVKQLHPDFVREILAENAARAIKVVASHVVAYGTTENGNRLTGIIATAGKDGQEAVIRSLFPILENRYESVEREDEVLVVVESNFDPVRADDLGVPAGPEFGRLANGEAITIDGQVISPDAVTETVERKIPIWSS